MMITYTLTWCNLSNIFMNHNACAIQINLKLLYTWICQTKSTIPEIILRKKGSQLMTLIEATPLHPLPQLHIDYKHTFLVFTHCWIIFSIIREATKIIIILRFHCGGGPGSAIPDYRVASVMLRRLTVSLFHRPSRLCTIILIFTIMQFSSLQVLGRTLYWCLLITKLVLSCVVAGGGRGVGRGVGKGLNSS